MFSTFLFDIFLQWMICLTSCYFCFKILLWSFEFRVIIILIWPNKLWRDINFSVFMKVLFHSTWSVSSNIWKPGHSIYLIAVRLECCLLQLYLFRELPSKKFEFNISMFPNFCRFPLIIYFIKLFMFMNSSLIEVLDLSYFSNYDV